VSFNPPPVIDGTLSAGKFTGKKEMVLDFNYKTYYSLIVLSGLDFELGGV
jgi:hypothetical protein